MSDLDATTFKGRFEWFYAVRLIPWLRRQPGVKLASQNELAKRLGENSPSIGTWRRGLAEPDEFRLERIAAKAEEKDPPAVARWLKHGLGQPPAPSGGPPSSSAGEIQGAQPIVDAVSLFERTRAALPPGAVEARAICDFAIETLRKARTIGIATIAPLGVGLAVLVGGGGSAKACSSVAQENQPFSPTRRTRGIVTRFPGAKRSTPRRSRGRGIRRVVARPKTTTRAAQTVRGTHAV